DELSAIGQTAEDVARRQSNLETEVAGQAQVLRTTHEHVARAERKLRRIHQILTGGEIDSAPPPAEAVGVPARLLQGDFDYAGFEERIRGGAPDDKARQRMYLDLLAGHENVLEIGCGRGDFLERLRDAGLQAKGVDRDLDMVLCCREKGFDVLREDAAV